MDPVEAGSDGRENGVYNRPSGPMTGMFPVIRAVGAKTNNSLSLEDA
jgi:hypothetical protein